MISTLKKILFHQDGQEHLRTPQDEIAEFLLQYRNLDVEHLSLDDGKWHFEYDDAFREKEGVCPIMDFPNLDKRYESDVLWPFFVVRIPGLGQPAIQRVIQEENLDPHNEVQLLKRFGKTTIANPFILIPKDNPDESEE